MRTFVTGGSGVLGRFLVPLLQSSGHETVAPRHADLDLDDAAAVRAAMDGTQAVYHLATRIPPPERMAAPDAWKENDHLRSVITSRLVDAALALGAETFVFPSIAFVYPPDVDADETTPVSRESESRRSVFEAEAAVQRFSDAGGRGVVLRLGLLWGPGTGSDQPQYRNGSVLHVEDAASALALALEVPPGLYNVVADGGRVSNARFKGATGWQPRY
jgi:nucleoside-diphosphate-sugar epimerase